MKFDIDIDGLQIGHFTDPRRPTGCTVLLCPQGAVAGVDVRGAAPGTRETDLLNPVNTVQQIHALLLCGGSAFGLDAATGVMQWLREHGHGLRVGPVHVPIVPAAVVFDLWVDDFEKHPQGSHITPDAQAGYAACIDAVQRKGALPLGNVGAGAGATVGKLNSPECAMRGGLGVAQLSVDGFQLAALVVCNAVGDVVDPSTGQWVAGARKSADSRELLHATQAQLSGLAMASPAMGSNTTIGAIVTDAPLTKVQATRLAQVAHDGLARCIRPVHTPMDGDTLFAIGTARQAGEVDMMRLITAAAEVTAQAVLCAVRHASDLRLGGRWWPAVGKHA
jgi:L-aminopeptidase/D-esterase-like protein